MLAGMKFASVPAQTEFSPPKSDDFTLTTVYDGILHAAPILIFIATVMIAYFTWRGFQRADEDRKAAQNQAAKDREVTQGILAALQELIRRTSPPGRAD